LFETILQILRASSVFKSANLHRIHGARWIDGSYSGAVSFLQDGDSYRSDAGANHVDLLRGNVRKIDHPPVHKRSAIVDSNIHGLPIFLIRHANEGIERQRSMGRRHVLIRVECLAIGCFATVIGLSVIGRQAFKFTSWN